MTWIFLGSMSTPSLSMMYPQKGTQLWKNVEFSLQRNSCCRRSSSCTKLRCRWCSSASFEKTRMSSMYTHTKIPKWSPRTSFTTRCNVYGALQRSRGITTHSKLPNCVLKAVFSTSSSWIRI